MGAFELPSSTVDQINLLIYANRVSKNYFTKNQWEQRKKKTAGFCIFREKTKEIHQLSYRSVC